MNQDNISTALWYCWIISMGVLGALNLRGIVKNIRDRESIQEEIKAKDTKIIMLEAKILYLETKLHDHTSTNRDSK